MKIGNFEVGEYVLKEEAGKKHLVFDCKNCPYSASVSDDVHCRYHVLFSLKEFEPDLIILSEVYDRVYEEAQTQMLKDVAGLLGKFEVESIWSYSHLGPKDSPECEKFLPQRHDVIVRIAHDLMSFDPLLSYVSCLKELQREKSQLESGGKDYSKCSNEYVNVLNHIKTEFEKLELVKRARNVLLQSKEIPDTQKLYRLFFEAEIKPSFIGSRLLFREREEQLELLDEYYVKDAQVQIFSHPNKTQRLYFINPPEYSLAPEKYFILSKTREIVSSYKPGKTSLSTVAMNRKYFERVYESTIRDIAKENKIELALEESQELSQVVARYTVGYGILELLLSDRRLTDIFLDAPIGGKPIYVTHSDFGQCQTNVLYTQSEADSLVSKLRAMSGRPFDEVHPVLDFDLPELDTRTAVIGPPLSPDGIAFAFRLHKLTPWTLCQFIDAKMLSSLCAGILSFLVDAQATMLVTGSRGSGKTSLLSALALEIPQNSRIIMQEDTLELPVPYMKEIGFNIQRLKTRSPISISKTETEVSPEESLRTALRLGDSALVLGEVRSLEAKVLYEAMRIGAAGNIVMGTIHGDSAYSVWDRVVNDLQVPNTSFKATDIVVVARPIRFEGSLQRTRRVVQLTEVKKHWISEPMQEKGFLDLMLYDARKDKLDLIEANLKESELFEKISKTTGMSNNEIWAMIKLNAKTKDYLCELKNKHSLPELLEANNTVLANNKFALLKEKQLQEHGSIDSVQVFDAWKEWIEENIVKKLLAKKS